MMLYKNSRNLTLMYFQENSVKQKEFVLNPDWSQIQLLFRGAKIQVLRDLKDLSPPKLEEVSFGDSSK